MTVQDQLLNALIELSEEELLILNGVALALKRRVEYSAPILNSDFVTAAFAQEFGHRLLVYHATHTQKATKEAFEHSFQRACQANGKIAVLSAKGTKGADIVVDDVPFSLKTESSVNISASRITVSKLMEASWMKHFKEKEEYSQAVVEHVMPHLRRYERLLCLRAFDVPNGVRYDLIELNLKVLRGINGIKATSFSDATSSGTCHSHILDQQDNEYFTLEFDGSAQKVKISKFRIDLCRKHGSWYVPMK